MPENGERQIENITQKLSENFELYKANECQKGVTRFLIFGNQFIVKNIYTIKTPKRLEGKEGKEEHIGVYRRRRMDYSAVIYI